MMLSDVGGWGGWRVFWTFNLFLKKENWICAMTWDHAASNINILINILLTRNLPIVSGVRQWSHPLMIPLHCLWAKLNNKTHGQFECDLTWFCFRFDFIRSHARCGCCSSVGWRGWGCWGMGSFKIGRPASREWKHFERRCKGCYDIVHFVKIPLFHLNSAVEILSKCTFPREQTEVFLLTQVQYRLTEYEFICPSGILT